MIRWRPRTYWRPGLTSAGSSADGTWHGYDVSRPGPPLPYSQHPSSSRALCGREPADIDDRMRDEPPEDTDAICARCWRESGRDPVALLERIAAVARRRAERRRRDRSFEEWRRRVIMVAPEDMLAFLERYEIHETEEFVRGALAAIAAEREREAQEVANDGR